VRQCGRRGGPGVRLGGRRDRCVEGIDRGDIGRDLAHLRAGVGMGQGCRRSMGGVQAAQGRGGVALTVAALASGVAVAAGVAVAVASGATLAATGTSGRATSAATTTSAATSATTTAAAATSATTTSATAAMGVGAAAAPGRRRDDRERT